MAIWVTGDKHGEWNDLKSSLEKLSKGDKLIVLGDFGFVFYSFDFKRNWYISEEKKLKKAQKYCKENEITLLFVDGNHENFNRLNEYENTELFGGKVHKIKDNIFHLKRGEVFKIEDKTFFVMGGANSIDKVNRVLNLDWWESEIPSREEFENGLVNLDKVKWNVDYILTHTIFEDLIEHLDCNKFRFRNDMNKYFQILKDECEYKHWYFGHFHLDRQVDEKHTCLYNTNKSISDCVYDKTVNTEHTETHII